MTGASVRIRDAGTEIEARLQELENRKSLALSCNSNPILAAVVLF